MLGAGLIVLVAAVAVSVGAITYNAAKGRVALNKDSQCPVDGPHSITTVIIDRTDPISAITEQDLRIRLRDLANETPQYGALYLYAIDGRPDGVGAPLFFRCNPGNASNVSEVTHSKRKVQARFEQSFSEPLNAVLKDLIRADRAPKSPIMEAIQTVGVTDFSGKAAAAAEPRRLIIVSDFMQNSDLVSFYGGGRGRDLIVPNVMDAPLGGVDVSLLFIQRPNRAGPSPDALRSVWRDYFIQSGVASPRVRSVKLTGANP